MEIIIKTKKQIDGIRESCKLAGNVLKHIKQFIEPGVSTNFVNEKANDFIIEHNAKSACLNYRDYPKETCISINEEICHGIPSNRILEEGDIVKIDVANILNDYYGDNCATFPVGDINEEASNLIETTKACLNRGIEEVYPGNLFDNIGYEITKLAYSRDYSVVYQLCGHGVGLQFHEPPQVNHYVPEKPTDGLKMKEGMIFTIEPMINCGQPTAVISEADHWTASTTDKRLSAQFEHTVLVTSDGHEILTL